MDLARYEAMDAQRFDPMRRKVGFSPNHSPLASRLIEPCALEEDSS